MTNYRLIVQCPDNLGIVAKVSQSISEHSGWIVEANQHSDHLNHRFFMRYEISGTEAPFDHVGFEADFGLIAEQFDMDWDLIDTSQRKHVVLMATKDSHCLADILHRHHEGNLDCHIDAIISNHQDLAQLAQWYDIPYHHVPITPDNKTKAYETIEGLWQQYHAQVIVLARFMQIIPPAICEKYMGKIINIHHSFLPSFIGANPYLQAHTRGVKLIGATCHYVTEDLDEGPIIEQDVVRVTHKETANDLVRLGKDVEKNVLARGLLYHLEDRVLLDHHKTVVFV
jgi:formyltetrahydrofolate deformylase